MTFLSRHKKVKIFTKCGLNVPKTKTKILVLDENEFPLSLCHRHKQYGMILMY